MWKGDPCFPTHSCHTFKTCFEFVVPITSKVLILSVDLLYISCRIDIHQFHPGPLKCFYVS